MSTTISITNNVNNLLDNQQKRLNAKAKEGLMHSVLMLVLTDNTFMERAKLLNDYLGDQGVVNLEDRNL